MPNRRTVFIVSDRTSITARMLSHNLLTQFDGRISAVSRCRSSIRWKKSNRVVQQCSKRQNAMPSGQ